MEELDKLLIRGGSRGQRARSNSKRCTTAHRQRQPRSRGWWSHGSAATSLRRRLKQLLRLRHQAGLANVVGSANGFGTTGRELRSFPRLPTAKETFLSKQNHLRWRNEACHTKSLHRSTKEPPHQPSMPPSHQATKPPSHQATKPPNTL